MNALLVLIAQRARRDRWQVSAWVIGTALLAVLTVAGVRSTYGTDADRRALLATAAANPVIMLFRGLPSGADEGAFVGFLILPFLAMLVAFMSTFLAVRHTRGEEDSGRAELVGATAAGRRSPLTATLIHGLIADVLVGVLTALALILAGLPSVGAILTGAATAAAGAVFLTVGLVGAEVFSSARAANTFAVWIVLATYLLGGIGNALGAPSDDLQRVDSAWPAWSSPFGWIENVRPFADDDPRPLLLTVGAVVVLSATAFALQSMRDTTAGLVAARRGRPSAPSGLSSSTALVWRLSRPAVAGWAAGGFITGILATRLSSLLGQAASDLPSVQAIVAALTRGGSIAQGSVSIFFTMLGILAACCGVHVVCRARQEETHGTAEHVLSAAVGRTRWLGDHLGVGFGGIVLVVAAGVVGAALGLVGGDPSLMGDVIVTGAGQVAAASVFLVATAVVFTAAPRLTIPLGWTLVMLGTVVGLFGALFRFPDWVVHLAPIADAPTVDAAGVDLRGLWGLLAAVVVGAVSASLLMRRRELAPTD